jgi:hypothetical protein
MQNDFVLEDLYGLCQRFITDNEIRCGNDIYQIDDLPFLDFVEEICELVGYFKDENNAQS